MTFLPIWIFYVFGMGSLQPVPNSPEFTNVETCMASMPHATSAENLHTGVTCWVKPETKK